MPVPQDNPAGRLHEVLRQLKDDVAKQTTIQEALAIVLGSTHPRGLARLHEHVAVMIRWPNETRRQIEALPVNHDLYLSWTAHVDEAMQWTGRWELPLENLTNQYNAADLVAIAFAAEELHLRLPELTIDEDKLSGLLELVQQLITEVRDDKSLTQEARIFLVRRLEEVQSALNHFRIVGYEGVADAMDKWVGGMMLLMPATHGHGPGWFRRFFAALDTAVRRTGELASTSQRVFGVLEQGRGFFEG